MSKGRVVELGGDMASAHCSRLLQIAGFEVIKVEPLKGDTLRRRSEGARALRGNEAPAAEMSAFVYANAGKRSVAVNLDAPQGRDLLERLVGSAAAVVCEPGETSVDIADVARNASPGIPVVALTHFGLFGPRRNAHANHFTDWAAGGYTYMTGRPDGPPRGGGGAWCSYAAGLVGAFTALSALHARSNGALSTDSPLLFDVSIQDVMVSLHQWTFSLYTHQGVIKRRSGNRHAESYHPMGFLPCKDGWVCVGAASQEQWERFCIAIDMPELIDDPRFDAGAKRFDHADEFDAVVAPWFDVRTRDEVVAQLQANKVPASRVLTVREVLEDEQLAFREFWAIAEAGGRQGRMPAAPVRFSGGTTVGGAAPSLGAHTMEVLEEIGYSQRELESLFTSGSISAPEFSR